MAAAPHPTRPAEMRIPVSFFRFWPAFYDPNAPLPSDRDDFLLFFSELLEPITAATPDEATPDRPYEWHITSVFDTCREPPSDPSRPAYANPYAIARLSYSGECHHDPTTNYDANLIMRATNTDPSVRTVCVPLFMIASHVRNYWPIYRTPRELPPATSPRFFCAFVVSNPTCKTRNRLAQLLNAYKSIHSCGGALNNCGIVAPRHYATYLQFLSQFKFSIACENQTSPVYLTEKLMNSWLGQTIPIYWGASLAPSWLNPKAFLYLPEAATDDDMRALVARVAELDNDPAAYAAMFREPLILPDAELPRAFSLNAIRDDLVECLRRARTPPGALADP